MRTVLLPALALAAALALCGCTEAEITGKSGDLLATSLPPPADLAAPPGPAHLSAAR